MNRELERIFTEQGGRGESYMAHPFKYFFSMVLRGFWTLPSSSRPLFFIHVYKFSFSKKFENFSKLGHPEKTYLLESLDFEIS